MNVRLSKDIRKLLRQKKVKAKIIGLCNKAMKLPGFDLWPGSLDKHHSFEGGLATHTYETLLAGLQLAESSPAVMDVVAAGCVFHDVGKLKCYEKQEWDIGHAWGKSYQYYDTYHVVLSYQMFMGASHEMPMTFRKQVGHCILAHHKRREYGSPVTPFTKEAWAVALADTASVTIFSDEYPRKPDSTQFLADDHGRLYKNER